MKVFSLAERIYAAVRLIPRGKVASYSQIAALAGNCNLRRYVGNALHKNPSNSFTPCHRLVFTDGHVDMKKYAITQDDFELMRLELEMQADKIPQDGKCSHNRLPL